MDLSSIAIADVLAVAAFLATWLAYAWVIDHSRFAPLTLSAAMDRQRTVWVETMLPRDNRIADTNILAGLQQGTAFFASASMLAIGGCLAVLGSSDTISTVLEDISPIDVSSGSVFDAKLIGLGVIFVYAFFKFSWGYRLFNYASILMGALPAASDAHTAAASAAVTKTALFLRLGGRAFNHGQRSFFFASAYLGWLIGPLPLLAATAFVLAVFLHRQFWSTSARALRD